MKTIESAGWAMMHHSMLDSTNAEACRCIAAGLTEKTAILANCQTAGHGRGQRIWESSVDKGMWVSLVLPITVPFETLTQSTLVLAMAVRETVERVSSVGLQAKWPNDLLYGSRKCCGLLVEAHIAEPAPRASDVAYVSLILGIGLNINHLEGDFPVTLRETATSLRLVAGREYSREHILRDMLCSVDHWFSLWTEQGFTPIRDAWLAANCTMGKRLVLPDGFGCTHGIAHDLAPDGALIVLADDGAFLRIDAGEIVFHNVPSHPSL